MAKETTAAAWRFFALAYGWSWGLWAVAAALGGSWTELPTAVPYLLGGIGPSLAALVLVVGRRDVDRAFRFLHRVVNLRQISPVWAAIIVGVAFAPSVLAVFTPVEIQAPAARGEVGVGASLLAVAVLAALAEEVGWRGYALDALLENRTKLGASLLVGLAWTTWHLPLYAVTGTVQYESSLWSLDFWCDMTTRLPLSVVFTWIYLNTGRSILSAIVLHALDNVASVVIDPVGVQSVVRLAITTGIATAVALGWRAEGGSDSR